MSAYEIDEEKSKLEKTLSCYRLTKPFEVSELVQVLQDEEKKISSNSSEKPLVLSDKKVCIISKGKIGLKISDVVQQAGFKSQILKPTHNSLASIDTGKIDMIIFNGDVLDNYEWKVLNELDRRAPNLPVVILVKQCGQKESMEIPDLGFMVLSKERFFTNQKWVNQLLDKLIHAV